MIITPILIVSLIIVFVAVWLFVNTIDPRKWLTFLISLILTPILYLYIFYPLVNIVSSYHHQKYFDAQAWKKKPELRYEMANAILTDSLIIGKTKNHITSLFGSPEWLGYDENLKVSSNQIWNYNLGFKPGAFNNLQECIEIKFANNKVASLKLYQLKKTFE